MTNRLLTLDDVAERLQVSRDWAGRLVSRGDIAATRVGKRRVRVSEESLAAFIAANTATPRRARKGSAA